MLTHPAILSISVPSLSNFALNWRASGTSTSSSTRLLFVHHVALALACHCLGPAATMIWTSRPVFRLTPLNAAIGKFLENWTLRRFIPGMLVLWPVARRATQILCSSVFDVFSIFQVNSVSIATPFVRVEASAYGPSSFNIGVSPLKFVDQFRGTRTSVPGSQVWRLAVAQGLPFHSGGLRGVRGRGISTGPQNW